MALACCTTRRCLPLISRVCSNVGCSASVLVQAGSFRTVILHHRVVVRTASTANKSTLADDFVPLPPSSALPVREVDLACSALAESVQAGDQAWFERVVRQLREVLEERQAVLASTGGDTSAATPRVAVTDTFTDLPTAGSRKGEQGEEAWLRALRLLETGAGTGLGAQDAAPADKSQGSGPGTLGLESGITSYLASFEPPPAQNEESPMLHEMVDTEQTHKYDEPSWARALRLLDSAEGGAASKDRLDQDTSHSLHEFDSVADKKEPSWVRALQLLEVASLQSNTPSAQSASIEEIAHEVEGVPFKEAWVRTLSLLENAALPGGGMGNDTIAPTKVDHANERPATVTDTSTPENKHEHAAGGKNMLDEGQQTRMKSYADLLQEADVDDISPGASVPLRFEPEMPLVDEKEKLMPTLPRKLTKQGQVPGVGPATATPSPESSSWSMPSGLPSMSTVKETRNDPFVEARGKGNLTSAVPSSPDDVIIESGELRKEDFVWSEHEFNDGEKRNRRMLRKFKREFKVMKRECPEGVRNPKLLTAALDLALACVKAYDLDTADAIYRRCLEECRRRGMPWDVKCLQDLATLRCKQNRQADAADLLEELASKAPPHPATFINLGTVYNQLRQYAKAETWFLQAVNLKGGTPGREDLWNLGIAKKNQGAFVEALPMLEQALAEFQEHESHHPVTIGKLHTSVGGCLYDMGRVEDSIEHFRQARELYMETIGEKSPLFCSAAEGLAKSLKALGRLDEAFEFLLEAFEVYARGAAVHPTPLFETLDMVLDIHKQQPSVSLARWESTIVAGIKNLDRRGLAEDGNAGLVMSRAGQVLMNAGSKSRQRAKDLLTRGVALIQGSHDAGEADLSYEVMQAQTLLRELEGV